MNASSIQTSWKLLGEVENAVNWFGPEEIRRGRRGSTLHLRFKGVMEAFLPHF